MSYGTVSVNEYDRPTHYATELTGHPAFEFEQPGADMTYDDDEINRDLDLAAMLDDQIVSKADAIARAELADAKAWLESLTSDEVTISRMLTDSGLLGTVRTSYSVCVYSPTLVHGTGDSAMLAAKDAARKLTAAKVA